MKEVGHSEDKDQEKNGRKKSSLLRLLSKELASEIGYIVIGFLSLIGSTVSNSAVPKVLSKIIDQATTHTNRSSSDKLQIYAIVIGGGVTSFLRTTSLRRAESNISARLRKACFSSLLVRYPISKLDSPEYAKEGEDRVSIQSVVSSDVDNVSNTITTKLASLLRSLSSVTYSTVSMIKLNPLLFGLSASIVPMIAITAISLSKFINKYKTELLSLKSSTLEFAQERIDNVYTVRLSNRSWDETSKYDEKQQRIVGLDNQIALLEGVMMGGLFMGTAASILAVVNAGGQAVKSGRMTTGGLMGFTTYSFLLGMGSSGIMKAMGDIRQGLKSAERVYDIILTNSVGNKELLKKNSLHIDDGNDAEKSSIQFNNVTFSYSSTSPIILQDFSLTIKRGEVLAIVGKNGSGKSTIAKLLSGLYTPSNGSITVDNKYKINELSREAQLQLISIVPQEPTIFNTSIRENLTYSNPNASNADIVTAMDQTNSKVFLEEIGLDYAPGRNGTKLSGGQKQRLVLSRAFLSKPSFLLLDEPQNNLDKDGEDAVHSAVDIARKNSQGLILITHRKESLNMADKVAVLKNGKIMEVLEKDGVDWKGKGAVFEEIMPDLI